MTLFIGNDRDAADWLVLNYHYTGRVPSNVQFVATWHRPGGLFGDTGEVVAAAFFSLPPTRWSAEVWELSRLVRRDDFSRPLSCFLSAAVAEVRRVRGCPLLVSFADVQQGHHGGIYKAAGWCQYGLRPAQMEGLTVNGVFVPGRSCNSRWGTRSPDELKRRFPDYLIEPKWDQGKWLYWKAINQYGKARAKALGLCSSGLNGEPPRIQRGRPGSIPGNCLKEQEELWGAA